MFHMTQTQRSVLGSIILALTMMFGSMSAHASLVSYNVFATHAVSAFVVSNIDLDITFFLDTSSFPTTGTATVEFSSVDVIFSTFDAAIPFPAPQSFTYANDQTGTQVFFGTVTLSPFSATVNSAGVISGLITGVQAGPGGANFRIARLSMGNNVPLGQVASLLFFQSAGVGLKTYVSDFPNLSTYSTPTPVSAVPLPAALPLFGSALAMLGMVGWRRKRRAAA